MTEAEPQQAAIADKLAKAALVSFLASTLTLLCALVAQFIVKADFHGGLATAAVVFAVFVGLAVLSFVLAVIALCKRTNYKAVAVLSLCVSGIYLVVVGSVLLTSG